ncbi:MAG: DMT family transporter [Pseudomonadota bacterium]
MLTKIVSVLALVFAPLFFSSNLLFGKIVIPHVEPWTLAFIRWALVGLILLPFVLPLLHRYRTAIAEQGTLIAIMGFLAMWVCGALVYQALLTTSATNATLIYLSSPVIIIVIEAAARGRQIALREAIGIFLASAGVISILVKGDLQNLFNLAFSQGDLLMVLAAIAWATYSTLLKSHGIAAIPNLLFLCVASLAAAALLLPYALVEIAFIRPAPTDLSVWAGSAGIVLSSSLVAFLAHQQAVRFAGPAIAGIFMYLLPGYGVGLAVLVLGETFETYHLVGILTILGGVVIATFPLSLMKRWRAAGAHQPAE